MKKALYTAKCSNAYDGTPGPEGVNWLCRGSVYEHDEGIFSVYEDDGEGNGSLLERFGSLEDAKTYADLYVRFLDAKGYSDTPECRAMMHFAVHHKYYEADECPPTCPNFYEKSCAIQHGHEI